MQSTIKYWWICIFLCAPFISKAQFAKADSLFKNGVHDQAALEYERVIFLSQDPDVVNLALYKKGLCLKEQKKHIEAYHTLNRANLFLEQDSINFNIRYEIALNAYLANDYPTALSQLAQIEYFFKDNGYNKVLFLHILVLNELMRWDEAKVKYEQLEQIYDVGTSSEEAYAFLDKLKLKNPDKAENLSYFLPGVGQMYAGYFFKGLVSGFLQALCVAYGAYGIYEGYFFSGGVAGIGLFWAFYSGGARHAKYLAQKKNEDTKNDHNTRIKKIILASMN